MSALTDYFTSLANKIRSKVGGSQTYTPLQMVNAIDDVYSAGAASVPTPASITPSNSSPVALTANTAVKPTAAGYAISSYSSVTPSDSSPVTLASGSIYKMGGAGKAVASVTNVTPASTQTPPSVSSGAIIKNVGSGTGYLINSYNVADPQMGDSFSAGFNYMKTGGYCYNERRDYKVAIGTVTRTTSADATVSCGFLPRKIIMYKAGSTSSVANGDVRYIYDVDWSSTKFIADYKNASGTNTLTYLNVSDYFEFYSNGFSVMKPSSTYTGTYYYMAIE